MYLDSKISYSCLEVRPHQHKAAKYLCGDSKENRKCKKLEEDGDGGVGWRKAGWMKKRGVGGGGLRLRFTRIAPRGV